MRGSCVALLCLLVGAIAACAYQRDNSAVNSGSPGATSLEHPIIRAELLPVPAGTVIALVRGTAYITRDREAIQIHGALALERDDLLQIHSDSAVLLRSPDRKEIELRREHGEWFRFSIREK
jgi:hypothetical protein